MKEISVQVPKRLVAGVVILLLILVSVISVTAGNQSTAYTVDGDTVYIDDENVYIATYPHTTSGGWVYINITSKKYGGEVDIMFGFDGTMARPRSCEWYDPRDVWVGESYRIPDVYFDMPAYFKYNYTAERIESQSAYDGTIFLWTKVENPGGGWDMDQVILDDWKLVDKYDFVIANLNTRKIYWSEMYHYDWRTIANENFQKIRYNYVGMNTWYLGTFNIQEDREYHIRVFLDVLPAIGRANGVKYTVAIKPAGETLSQAKNSGHLYCLDPWLNWGWDQRVKITINSTDVDAQLSNFPVLVHLSNSTAGENNEDVSFIFDEIGANSKKIAFTTSDGQTQLYAEIDWWDAANERAWLWVNVPVVNNTADTDIYMYFDNDHADNNGFIGATGEAAGHKAWNDDYTYVSHMRDDPNNAHTADSTVHDNDGDKLGANEPIVFPAGPINDAQDFDFNDDYINIGTDIYTNPPIMTIETWIRIDGKVGYNAILSRWESVTQSYFLGLDSNTAKLIIFIDEFADGQVTNAEVPVDQWIHVAMVFSAGTIVFYVDGAVEASAEFGAIPATIPVTVQNTSIGYDYERDAFPFNGPIDEMRVSNVSRAAAWIKTGYETGRDHILDFGNEEFVTISTATVCTTTTNVSTVCTTTTSTTETSFFTTTTSCTTSVSTSLTTSTSCLTSVSTSETTSTTYETSVSTSETCTTSVETSETTSTICTTSVSTSETTSTTCITSVSTSETCTTSCISSTSTSISSTTTCTSTSSSTTKTSVSTSITSTTTYDTTVFASTTLNMTSTLTSYNSTTTLTTVVGVIITEGGSWNIIMFVLIVGTALMGGFILYRRRPW